MLGVAHTEFKAGTSDEHRLELTPITEGTVQASAGQSKAASFVESHRLISQRVMHLK
jgi:hypothetical protein